MSVPRSCLNREVQLAGLSRLAGWTVLSCCRLACSSAVAFFFWTLSQFVTLFRTAGERASSGVGKLLRPGGVPTSLTFIVLAVADSLFRRMAGS